MADMKREFKIFTIMEYEQEQEYLREKHNEGWKFIKVNFPGFYYFEKCEPEDVIYQLDYNQEGRSNRDTYVKMFADCGWEYVLDFARYSYFRKPVSEMNGSEESIFCDDASRLAMMERVFKGRMIPVMIIFCAILIPAFFSVLTSSGRIDYSYAAVLLLPFIVWVPIFIRFSMKYRAYKHDHK